MEAFKIFAQTNLKAPAQIGMREDLPEKENIKERAKERERERQRVGGVRIINRNNEQTERE